MTLTLKVGGWDGVGGNRCDILKDQKLPAGMKGCVFVCELNWGGDVAQMKDVAGPGLTAGHKKGCVA